MKLLSLYVLILSFLSLVLEGDEVSSHFLLNLLFFSNYFNLAKVLFFRQSIEIYAFWARDQQGNCQDFVHFSFWGSQNCNIILVQEVKNNLILFRLLLVEQNQNRLNIVVRVLFLSVGPLDERYNCLLLSEIGDAGLLGPSLPVNVLHPITAFLKSIVLLALLLGEVVDLWPVVVPAVELEPIELALHLWVLRSIEGGEMQWGAALHHRLALAVNGEIAVMAIVGPELPSRAHDPQLGTVPDEDAALDGGRIDEALGAIVNVDVGGGVEN